MQRRMECGQHRPIGRWMLAAMVTFLVTSVSFVDAHATTALRVDLEDHVDLSDAIVLVEVLEKRTFRGEDGIIYTDTTLKVEDTLMGSLAVGEEVTIRQMGGELDGVNQIIPGDARFEKGESAVVFLADREPENNVLFLTQMAQSKYAAVGKNTDGETILLRDQQGLIFYDPGANEMEPAPNDSTTLESLKEDIAAILEKNGGER